jgi:hypothetical protein
MTDEPVVDRAPAGVALGCLVELRSVPDWASGDLLERAITLDRLETIVALCKEAIGLLELDLAESMEEDTMVTPVGLLRRTEKVSSTWKYDGAGDQFRDDLAVAVVRHVAADNATGELDPIKRNIAHATLRQLFEVIPAVSTVKAGSKRAIGIDIGDYRSFSRHYTVRIEGAPDEG